MINDHSDSERGNPLPPLQGLLISISSRGYFFMHHPTDRITHTTAFVTPVVEHWMEREEFRLMRCLGSLCVFWTNKALPKTTTTRPKNPNISNLHTHARAHTHTHTTATRTKQAP